jgi:hypothetical protein
LAASVDATVANAASEINGITVAQVSADKLPKAGKHPYVPPKSKGNEPYKKTKQGGYIDADGNTWDWAKDQHGGPHWDVQHPNQSHTNVDENGNVIGKTDNFP